MSRKIRINLLLSLLFFLLLGLSGQSRAESVINGTPQPDASSGWVKIAVTLPDVASIVQMIAGETVEIVQIMPPGADPHSYSLTAEDVQKLTNCKLVVYGHGGFLHFEEELKMAIPDVPSLDFPDYQKNGAILKDFPGYKQCLHGSYSSFDNARAIAVTVAAWLVTNGIDQTLVNNNLVTFTRELEGLKAVGHQLMPETEIGTSVWVAMVPEEVYFIDNLGLGVGAVLMDEGSGAVPADVLTDVEKKLKSGEYMGIVCPLNMKDASPGEMSRQIASDTGAPVAYIQMLQSGGSTTYFSELAYNAGAIAAAGASAKKPEKSEYSNSTSTLIWGFIVFALVIALVMQNRRSYHQ
jgi:zinc/manganese transport system substrate-binding protein